MITDRTSFEDAARLVFEYRDGPEDMIARVQADKNQKWRPLRRTGEEVDERAAAAPAIARQSLEALAARLDRVNSELLNKTTKLRAEIEPGFVVKWLPVSRIGVYVPRGMASTAFTFFSAARTAGVREIVMYAAADDSGELDPLTAVAALRYEVDVLCGPARLAFPVLAFGSGHEVTGCDLVCGPCSTRMNVIKQIACVAAGAACDMWAGASELAVVADESANWNQVIRDLQSQLEHGPDSSAVLVLLGAGSRRSWDAAGASDGGKRIRILEADGVQDAARIVNQAAPETVEVWTQEPTESGELIESAGVVYLRLSSSLGDYGAAGRGCADPTNRLARGQSGLSPFTFLRLLPVVSRSSARRALAEAASEIAAYEELRAHQEAIEHQLAGLDE